VSSDSLTIALVSIGGAIVGGPVWSFLSMCLKIGAGKRKTDYERLEARVATAEQLHKDCEAKHGILETRLKAVEQRDASYFALWIKDRAGRLVWLNDKAFLTIFAPLGLTRAELDGKTFKDLLDPQAAIEIEMLDKAALTHPGATQSILIQLHPDLPFMVVIKVAAIAENGDVQYEGCAFTPGDPEIRSAAGIRREIIQRAESFEHLIAAKEDEK
jgi:hypothetical protein